MDSYPVLTTAGVLGKSRAGSSAILMASFMPASRPWPPSPLSAGPKHSGRLISSFTTTLAFSSTLSPGKQQTNGHAFMRFLQSWQQSNYIAAVRRHKIRSTTSQHTIAEDSKPQEGQVTLSLYRVPAQVWVTLSNQHGTTLQTTTCQVCHHLHIQTPKYYDGTQYL